MQLRRIRIIEKTPNDWSIIPYCPINFSSNPFMVY
jgi:hypothetical protein